MPLKPRKKKESNGVPRFLVTERRLAALSANGKLETGDKRRQKYSVINFLVCEAEGSQRLSLAAGAQAHDLSHLDSVS